MLYRVAYTLESQVIDTDLGLPPVCQIGGGGSGDGLGGGGRGFLGCWQCYIFTLRTYSSLCLCFMDFSMYLMSIRYISQGAYERC